MPSVNTRVFFSKTDRAKYISHLDLYRVFQRAIVKSKLPVWYTEGFNPRLYIQFMLPLSLGQEGLREVADFRLTEDVPPEEVTERLNAALPLDLRITETSVPVMKNTDIAEAEYEIEAELDREKFARFAESEHIFVEKKTKKGVSEIDLKPHVKNLKIGDKIRVRLPAGNEFNINPALLFEAFEKQTGEKIKRLKITRTEIYAQNGEIFR